MQRTGWLFLAVGIVLGAVGGLYYAWIINPVEYIDVAPSQLGLEEQEGYIVLISEAYLQERSLPRARARLEQLGLGGEAVAALADDMLLAGGDPEDIRALSALAVAFGEQPEAAEVFAGTVALPTLTPTVETTALVPSPTPEPTITPTIALPTDLPTVEAGETYELLSREELCEPGSAGRMEVYVLRGDGSGIPNIPVVVTWPEGEDRFFTGLRPAISIGYADFQMQPDRTYTVTLEGFSRPVAGLSSFTCETEAGTFQMPGYRLVFGVPSEN